MKKSVVIMCHLLFWVFSSLLITLGFNLLAIPAAIFGGKGPDVWSQLSALLITLPIGAIIFYASYFLFNFFAKKPSRVSWLTFAYILSITVLVLFELYNSRKVDFLDILIIFLPIEYFNAFGFLFRTFIEWIKDRKIKAELEKDKLASQLELLKAQINPHFLFNTLNNIDVLIQEEPLKASEFLKKLSEILRFILYESDSATIPLAKEIEYARKYIDLQKIRTSNENFVKLEISGNENGKFIAPLIFVHFIENAFKFATNKKVENAISIKIEISEKRVSFFCRNNINRSEVSHDEIKGLGLNLIKQRLDLIYQNTYNLTFKEEDNWYIVNLEIQLNEY